jgi:hypothetical protein
MALEVLGDLVGASLHQQHPRPAPARLLRLWGLVKQVPAPAHGPNFEKSKPKKQDPKK